MKFSKHYALIIFLLSFSVSCKKDSIVSSSPSFNYFPTEQGKYVIYDVDSILHGENDNNTDDSVYHWHFQIKEMIGSAFLDGQGRSAQRVRRFRRDNDTLAWNEVNVWTQVLTSSSAYKTEDNVAYHKLAFPISNHITWDGNDANTMEQELYTYDSFHSSLTMSGLSFDSTLTVLQRDEDNFVQKIYSKEIYANNIGMIYKERDDLGKVNGLPVKGTEYKMQVRSYGSE